jgi:FlaA1/EpsC-like NDP-sugar epimerase
MEKIKNAIKNDLWIVVLDICAVNFAYFLALELRKRMSVGFEYGTTFSVFSGVLFRFAPLYTVLCIVVFYCFRLYGGLWRYAGFNDINRVVGANIVTSVIYVVGSLFYVKSTTFDHMPITYYAFGAFFQFFFICLIRFSYRIFVVERGRVGKKQATALVVGAGELGRHTVQVLQSGVYFNVGCVVDTENEYVGRFLDGVPVYDKEQIEKLLDKYGVSCVFLAEPDLKEQDRDTIKKICENHSIEIRDYSNFFKVSVEMESNVADVPSGKRKIPMPVRM